MAIDPKDIQLTESQRQFIAELAQQEGRSPQEILARLLGPQRMGGSNGGRQATTVSAHELGQRLGLFGALEDGPEDLSTNRRYLEGFGQGAARASTD